MVEEDDTYVASGTETMGAAPCAYGDDMFRRPQLARPDPCRSSLSDQRRWGLHSLFAIGRLHKLEADFTSPALGPRSPSSFLVPRTLSITNRSQADSPPSKDHLPNSSKPPNGSLLPYGVPCCGRIIKPDNFPRLPTAEYILVTAWPLQSYVCISSIHAASRQEHRRRIGGVTDMHAGYRLIRTLRSHCNYANARGLRLTSYHLRDQGNPWIVMTS